MLFGRIYTLEFLALAAEALLAAVGLDGLIEPADQVTQLLGEPVGLVAAGFLVEWHKKGRTLILPSEQVDERNSSDAGLSGFQATAKTTAPGKGRCRTDEGQGPGNGFVSGREHEIADGSSGVGGIGATEVVGFREEPAELRVVD